MSEENKAIVRQLHNMTKETLPTRFDQLYAADLTYHGTGELANADRDTLKHFVSAIFDAFSDFSITQEEVLAEGDRVTYRNTYSGTHTGEFMGIPATGKTVTVGSIGIARISGGKIVEEWESMDEMGMMQQLGVIPSE